LSEIIAYAALIPLLSRQKGADGGAFRRPAPAAQKARQKGNGFFTFSVASFAELVYTASLIPR
jgi:hypothetical protein